jgi:hypothetical protein
VSISDFSVVDFSEGPREGTATAEARKPAEAERRLEEQQQLKACEEENVVEALAMWPLVMMLAEGKSI